jgi:hypothetical protein
MPTLDPNEKPVKRAIQRSSGPIIDWASLNDHASKGDRITVNEGRTLFCYRDPIPDKRGDQMLTASNFYLLDEKV